jgi:hypothetical protein
MPDGRLGRADPHCGQAGVRNPQGAALMDAFHIVRLTRVVSTVLSRRAVAGALGLGALALPSLADAKKHKKKCTVGKKTRGKTCVDLQTAR